MPHTAPACPQCGQENTYPDGENFICPDCAHEWPQAAASGDDEATGDGVVRDANGNLLKEGDTIQAIKDLKVKGSSATLKRGTLIRNIRLTDDEKLVEGNADKVKGLILEVQYFKKV